MPQPDGIHVSSAELIALRARARGAALPMRQPSVSALAGPYHSRFRGRGIDFVESRQYQPGDDIRNMDWRVTARTGKPHTKLFQEERERPILLLVDANPSMFFGTQGCLKSVAAARLAAAVCWRAVRRGDRIGAFLFGAGAHQELRPTGGRRGAMRVIQSLVKWLNPPQQPPAQQDNLVSALERVRKVVRPGSLIIVVSDFFNLGDQAMRHLSRLRVHNDIVGCQVLDPAEKQLPAGMYPVNDGSKNSILNTVNKQQRQRYEAMVKQHLDEPRRLFQSLDCLWMVLSTTTDPITLLDHALPLLQRRRQR